MQLCKKCHGKRGKSCVTTLEETLPSICCDENNDQQQDFCEDDKGISLFKFPLANVEICKLWQDYIEPGYTATASTRLCHLEFHPSMYSVHQKNGKVTRKLRADAIPGAFVPMESGHPSIDEFQAKQAFLKSLDYQNKNQCDQVIFLEKTLWNLNSQYTNLMEGLRKFLNPDQILRVENHKTKVTSPWSSETIQTCMRYWLKNGTTGYEDFQSTWPLVSLRTLQENLALVDFPPGHLQVAIDVIGEKVKAVPDIGLGVISLDEMTLKAGTHFDQRLKAFVGLESEELKRDNDIEDDAWTPATHVNTVMFRSIKYHMKQLVSYDFTGASMDGAKLWRYLTELIFKLHQKGAFVACISSDMGTSNVAMWREPQVFANRNSIKVTTQHPADPERLLVITPDPPHGLKGIKRMALTYNICVPDWYQQQHNLPSKVIKLNQHLSDLIGIQEQYCLFLAPGLTREVLVPKDWQSMRVGDALRVFNKKVAAALRLGVEQKWIEEDGLVTAQFVSTVTTWYSTMTARHVWNGLKKEGSEIELEQLKETRNLFQQLIPLDSKQQWLQNMTAVVMCTEAVLTLHRLYVVEGQLDYFLPSRMTTECNENLFSQVRVGGGDAYPTAPQVISSMKKIMLTHAMQHPKGSNYADSGDTNLGSLFDFLKKAPRKVPVEPDNLNTFEETSATEDNLADFEKFALYHLAGWSMKKVTTVKPVKGCDECENSLFCTAEEAQSAEPPMPYNFTLTLSEGRLRFVRNPVYSLSEKLLVFYRAKMKQLTSGEDKLLASSATLQEISDSFAVSSVGRDFASSIPCHGKSVIQKFSNYFIGSVNKRYCMLKNMEARADKTDYAGKSSLMRTSVEGTKSSGKRAASNDPTENTKRTKTSAGVPKDVGLVSKNGSVELCSLVQALYTSEKIKERLLTDSPSQTPVVCELRELLRKLKGSKFQVESVHGLEVQLRNKFDFQGLSLNKLYEKLLAEMEKDPIGGIAASQFRGQVTCELVCYVCAEVRSEKQDFFNLQLKVNGLANRVQKLLDELSVSETSDDFMCSQCQLQGVMCSKKYVSEAPQILVLHLDRFSGGIKKNTSPLIIEDVITLTLHTKTEEPKKKIEKYSLFSTMIVQGEREVGGRNLCLAKRRNRWTLLENEHIKAISKAKVISTFSMDAAMLFYHKL